MVSEGEAECPVDGDLLRCKVLDLKLSCSSPNETDDVEKPFQRRADHWHPVGASGRARRVGVVPQARDERREVL